MSIEHKHQTSNIESLVGNIGMAVVAMATVLNLAELSGREGHRMAAIMQPAYAIAGSQHGDENQNNGELRRSGREEIRHTSATYGNVSRSHATSGKA